MQKLVLVATATVAVLSWDMMASAAGAMSLAFSWAGVASCSPSPPAFTLSGVPRGTTRLAFNMVDLDLPSYPHGGGMIPFQGNQVPAGSFSYTGPCPPVGQHTYRWTVQALDSTGKVLATAAASRPFPPR